jgi:hypothetical protein
LGAALKSAAPLHGAATSRGDIVQDNNIVMPIGQACAGGGGAALGGMVAPDMIAPWTVITGAVDEGLLFLRAETRKNLRRFLSLLLALGPVAMLLVGSCKTAELPGAYGSSAGSEQFRTALFPDRVNFKGIDYYPAEGYISRAQKYVAGTPDTLTMLTMREITYLFGAPALKRTDSSAEVWQYRGKSCVVDFYFYHQPGTRDEDRVAYADVRYKNARDAQGLPRRAQTDCLEKVIDTGDFSGTRI